MKKYKFILYNSVLGQQEVSDPDGWKDTEFTKSKSDRYWALEYNVSGKYDFIKDGYDYLVSAFNIDGIETDVFCQVRIFLKTEKRYKTIFTGKVDFLTREVTEKRYSVNIEKLDVARKLINRDEETVNLEELVTLDDTVISAYSQELITVPMHSKTIKREYQGEITQTKSFQLGVTFPIDVLNTLTYQQLYQFDSVVNDLDVTGFNLDSSTVHDWTEKSGDSFTPTFTIDVEAEKLYIFEVKEKGTYTFTINFDFYLYLATGGAVNDACDFKFYLVFINSEQRVITIPYTQRIDTVSLETLNYVDSSGTPQTKQLWRTNLQEINEVFTRDLVEGDEVYIYTELETNGSTANETETWIEILPSSINIAGLTTFEETNCQGMLAHEYFDRLVTKITGRENSFYSELLGRTDSEPRAYSIDGEGSLIMFTNGYKIRELNDRPLFASFWDAFQTIDTIYNCALGIEYIEGKQVIRLEKKEYFYNTSRLVVGAKPDYTREIAKEYVFSNIEIGYKKWKNEQKNNLDEFNTKHQYSLPISRIKKKKSLIAPFLAAGYSIEESRRMKFKTTEDNDNDEENFVIKLVRTASGYRPQTTDGFSSITNVIDPDTVYNADISPKRNFLRWGKYVNISTYLLDDRKIKFNFGEGNYLMQSTKSGETIIENADINVSDLPSRYFKPERLKLERFKISEEDLIKIYNATSLVVEFQGYNGVIFGLVDSVRVRPHDLSIEADVLEITTDIAREIVIPDSEAEITGGFDYELDFEV